jgi:tyrosyl-tRNA synthetase
MFRYWDLLTTLPSDELQAMREAVAAGTLHPMEAKQRLARVLVEDFHDAAAAERAEEHFARVHQRRQLPENIEEVALPLDADATCLTALLETGLAASRSEARRLIKSGAVSVDGRKVTDAAALLPPGPFVLRCGKLRFVRVTRA